MLSDSVGLIQQSRATLLAQVEQLQTAIAVLDKCLAQKSWRNISGEVHYCSRGQMGWFTSRDIDAELGLFGKQKHTRKQEMHRMVQKGLLERHPTRRATFRNVGDA